MILNDGGIMEKINLSKTCSIANLVIVGGFSILWGYVLIRLGAKNKEPFVGKLIVIAFGIVLLLYLTKNFFEVLITLLRFYNLRIEMLRDKLVLRTKTKECEIPMTKDTNVVCCMEGWLISWPSEKGQGIILLPRALLGDHFEELCFYFQENTNYIPSRSLLQTSRFGVPIGFPLGYYQPNADYVTAKEDEKKLLKSLQINKWNRLKYIKWPS
jgi:hypothetical protein